MSALHDLLAELERHLISAYLAGAGHDLEALEGRTDVEARRLLADATGDPVGARSRPRARSVPTSLVRTSPADLPPGRPRAALAALH